MWIAPCAARCMQQAMIGSNICSEGQRRTKPGEPHGKPHLSLNGLVLLGGGALLLRSSLQCLLSSSSLTPCSTAQQLCRAPSGPLRVPSLRVACPECWITLVTCSA